MHVKIYVQWSHLLVKFISIHFSFKWQNPIFASALNRGLFVRLALPCEDHGCSSCSWYLLKSRFSPREPPWCPSLSPLKQKYLPIMSPFVNALVFALKSQSQVRKEWNRDIIYQLDPDWDPLIMLNIKSIFPTKVSSIILIIIVNYIMCMWDPITLSLKTYPHYGIPKNLSIKPRSTEWHPPFGLTAPHRVALLEWNLVLLASIICILYSSIDQQYIHIMEPLGRSYKAPRAYPSSPGARNDTRHSASQPHSGLLYLNGTSCYLYSLHVHSPLHNGTADWMKALKESPS